MLIFLMMPGEREVNCALQKEASRLKPFRGVAG